MPPPKKPVTRRVWTRPEEEALIDGLKELVANGWRADNSFRPGYLLQLETAVKSRFPNSNITGVKHINSKLTVWKKTYGQVCGICDTSGFDFNYEKNMISYVSDDVWDTYVKVHPDVDNFRNKSFPYFKDWIVIFGKDRATGKFAQTVGDAILNLERDHDVTDVVYDKHTLNGALGKGKAARNVGYAGSMSNMDGQSEDNEGVDSNFGDETAAPNVTGDTTKKGKTRKRKGMEPPTQLAEQVVSLLKNLFGDTNTMLGGIVEKMTTSNTPVQAPPPPSPPNKAKQVFDIVGDMTQLPLELRIIVAHKILNSANDIDLFLTMDRMCQSTYVQLLIQGSLDGGCGKTGGAS